MNRLCAGSPTVAHSADCLLLRRWQRHDVSSHGTTCSKLPATQHFPPRKSHIAVFSISETWGEDRNYTKVLHFPHLVGNKTNKQKLSYFNHSKIVVFAPMFLCQELIRNWVFFHFLSILVYWSYSLQNQSKKWQVRGRESVIAVVLEQSFLLGDVKLLCGVESSEVRGSQAQNTLACLSFKSTMVSKSGHLISDEHHALNILLLPLSCQQTYYLCI